MLGHYLSLLWFFLRLNQVFCPDNKKRHTWGCQSFELDELVQILMYDRPILSMILAKRVYYFVRDKLHMWAKLGHLDSKMDVRLCLTGGSDFLCWTYFKIFCHYRLLWLCYYVHIPECYRDKITMSPECDRDKVNVSGLAGWLGTFTWIDICDTSGHNFLISYILVNGRPKIVLSQDFINKRFAPQIFISCSDMDFVQTVSRILEMYTFEEERAMCVDRERHHLYNCF